MTTLPNVDYFKELPFYNVYIDKSIIKPLKNVDLLAELPFYNQLNIKNQIMHLVDMQCHAKLK